MRIFIFGLVVFVAGLTAAGALADKPPAPPGKDPCSHGNTGKPCRPDPQPDRGKDCEKHGNEGGINEDHCLGETTPPTTTQPPTTQPPKTNPPTSTPPDSSPPAAIPSVVTAPGVTQPSATTSSAGAAQDSGKSKSAQPSADASPNPAEEPTFIPPKSGTLPFTP